MRTRIICHNQWVDRTNYWFEIFDGRLWTSFHSKDGKQKEHWAMEIDRRDIIKIIWALIKEFFSNRVKTNTNSWR